VRNIQGHVGGAARIQGPSVTHDSGSRWTEFCSNNSLCLDSSIPDHESGGPSLERRRSRHRVRRPAPNPTAALPPVFRLSLSPRSSAIACSPVNTIRRTPAGRLIDDVAGQPCGWPVSIKARTSSRKHRDLTQQMRVATELQSRGLRIAPVRTCRTNTPDDGEGEPRPRRSQPRSSRKSPALGH
jgi:hypothetical protein